jgi:membrane protein DedA with SNARE-associated domain
LHFRWRDRVPSWLEGRPFAITFGVLFLIVLLRAQGTYWIGRGVTAGVLHTRWARKISGPRTTKAITALNRWGPPLVTVSFLTVGFQTVVNAAAGLIRMPWIRYTIAMMVGCVAWALIYATIGFAAVDAALALAARSPWALVAVVALLLVAAAVVVVVLRRRKSRQSGGMVSSTVSGR